MMQKTIALCAFLLLAGCDRGVPDGGVNNIASDIKPDETLVFFRTSGWLDSASEQWLLPVHGWIYEPQDSTFRKAAFEKVLQDRFDLSVTKQTEANLARRLNLLIADNERGKSIVVKIAGSTYELPASVENGHFEKVIAIPAARVAKHSKNGFVRYAAVIDDSDAREFTGTIRLLDPNGFSVISDIDDTVKVSNVTDRKRLLEHAFLLDFSAAPGMAELYREWSAEDTGFHFVSSSPWQLYEPLSEFLDESGFPWATFSLKAVRFRDDTLLDLFRKGTETKPDTIREILDRYPGRKFVLVGDSGEQDPEVYASLLRERPGQIVKIYIRNVTRESADSARFTTLFEDIDEDRWQLFEDPATVILPRNLWRRSISGSGQVVIDPADVSNRRLE
jgi:hypothetical protein